VFVLQKSTEKTLLFYNFFKDITATIRQKNEIL